LTQGAGLAEASRSGCYLLPLERQRLATLHAQCVTIRDVARRLGRAPSTVTRELRRNTLRRDDRRHTTVPIADRPAGPVIRSPSQFRPAEIRLCLSSGLVDAFWGR